MILHLKVEVPSSVDGVEALAQLLTAQGKGEGITIVTARRHYMDVDLVDVERGAV
jgi:hypothetical protein